MRVLLASALFSLVISQSATGQTPILPDLFGDELIEQLSLLYAPETLLNFTQVKDTLYAVIDLGDDDSVRCIYSERAIFLPPGADPSQAVFMNGSGINLEHIWPQSKGAGDGTDGQTDMYHLAPSRVDVNSMRANNPFGEIADNQTNKWYYLNLSLTSVPTQMIEVYSEADDLLFEPKEDRKGDIARAMFYFFTIHNDDADKAFFEEQVTTLCEWHLADPVDDKEFMRGEHIAQYQGNMNPFLIDCTLPSRAFCGSGLNCTTSSDPEIPLAGIKIGIRRCTVYITSEIAGQVRVTNRLYSMNGIEQLTVTNALEPESGSISLNACALPNGVYFLTTEVEKNSSRIMLPTRQIAIY